jgi:hypothetical protein
VEDQDRSLWHGLRLGLRARIALAVALVTLILSTAVSLTTLTVARQTLIDAREETATRRALANAEVIAGRNLQTSEASDLQTTLSSLSDVGRPSIVWDGGRRTVSLDPRYTVDDLPPALVDRAIKLGRPGIMRYQGGRESLVAVAVPIADQYNGQAPAQAPNSSQPLHSAGA